MVELFEQNIRTSSRQSSKENQLKWENDDIWYKADYTGYEGVAEYVISLLLKYTNLNEDEYVLYGQEMHFLFTKKNVSDIVNNADMYPPEERKRVELILYSQMNKYQYLFR